MPIIPAPRGWNRRHAGSSRSFWLYGEFQVSIGYSMRKKKTNNNPAIPGWGSVWDQAGDQSENAGKTQEEMLQDIILGQEFFWLWAQNTSHRRKKMTRDYIRLKVSMHMDGVGWDGGIKWRDSLQNGRRYLCAIIQWNMKGNEKSQIIQLKTGKLT